MKDQIWKWIGYPETGQRLEDIGILADGSLHNPNGYPEHLVRQLVQGAIDRRDKRRKDAAAKAVITRKRRRDKHVNDIAAKILRDENIGPSSKCVVCRRKLDDDASIARGVGSECWQELLRTVDQATRKAA